MKIDTSIRTYTDKSGTVWSFRFTVGLMRKLADPPLSVDLLDFSRGENYSLQLSDWKFFQVVAAILGIDEKHQLFDELDEVQLPLLRQAFWGGLGFFIQTSNPTKWQLMEQMMEQVETRGHRLVQQQMEKLDT